VELEKIRKLLFSVMIFSLISIITILVGLTYISSKNSAGPYDINKDGKLDGKDWLLLGTNQKVEIIRASYIHQNVPFTDGTVYSGIYEMDIYYGKEKGENELAQMLLILCKLVRENKI